MTRDASKNREQIQLLSLDDLVPQNHLVRKLEAAINWSFIYDLVEEKYSDNTGRPMVCTHNLGNKLSEAIVLNSTS